MHEIQGVRLKLVNIFCFLYEFSFNKHFDRPNTFDLMNLPKISNALVLIYTIFLDHKMLFNGGHLHTCALRFFHDLVSEIYKYSQSCLFI